MYVESVTLRNFRCFADPGVRVELQSDLTAFIGNNGTGKTAACQALQRLFGITSDERTVRVDDFHVPADETDAPDERSLSIEAVLAFPELKTGGGYAAGIAGFFTHVAADASGELKCRILLQSTWTADGTVDGTVETTISAISTFEETFTEQQMHALSAADRSRIQFVYVPASRDGARQVTTFLRGRLWRAARWSDELREEVRKSAESVGIRFHEEEATKAVEAAVRERWQELHGAGTHSTPRFHPLETEVEELLRAAELTFEPDRTSVARPARLLSDGQRSLVHLALTTASLDLEEIAREDLLGLTFDMSVAMLPDLTVLAVEEPENNLSAFYLSRIIKQLLDLGASDRVQVLLSSHSASALTRVGPANVRYFRQVAPAASVEVRPVVLPTDATEAGTYVREAVRAHPELYFARFVILGEGDSEQIVLPALARALGVELDPSFVAMVPLGGRHTQHFWRLLNDLGIPHATLLDLDYGRAGGGGGRLRDAVTNLRAVDKNALAGVAGISEPVDVRDDLDGNEIKRVMDGLAEHGVFFSTPLDLDMVMLRTFPDAYRALEAGATGPGSGDAAETVLGTGGLAAQRAYWTAGPQLETRREELRWYRYLFSNRSKPATHLRALTAISDADLAAGAPRELDALIRYMEARLRP
jgi:ABC-type cobalamin/Fe3+-siderophores transport system ATPase subunit